MKEKKTLFGTFQNQPIYRYELTNDRQTKLAVSEYGAVLQEFSCLVKNKRQQLIVNFNQLKKYQQDIYQIGKTIGPVAGRIKDARFLLNHKTIFLEKNEGNNCLHSGSHGFDKQVFQGSFQGPNSICLQAKIEGDLTGFPGNLTLLIKYTLTEDDRLILDYQVKSDTTTVFDPTLHVYWQLEEDLQDDYLKVAAQKRVETKDKLPTGRLLSLAGTAYDLRNCYLPAALDKLRSKTDRVGFDDAFAVVPSLQRPIVEILRPKLGLTIKIYSQRNGVVLFTADPKNKSNDDAGKFNSLAVEVQTLPDAVHHLEFGSIELGPGENKMIRQIFQISRIE
jgi:aldose 1-epimerase